MQLVDRLDQGLFTSSPAAAGGGAGAGVLGYQARAALRGAGTSSFFRPSNIGKNKQTASKHQNQTNKH